MLGVQQVVDTEGDSYLGGKDIDYALVDSILIPFVKKNYKVDMILASEKKAAIFREALKVYAEAAKVALSTAPSVDVLSDLGEFGCDAYFRHNRELMFDVKRQKILDRIVEKG